MASFNEARSPLTAENVQQWARKNFPEPFRALPRAARLHWIEFDKSFTINRAIWRSLGRSAHKQLLVIGGYAPGQDNEEPTDRVTAHVHADEAEVSFYRIAELDDGSNELHSVTSTSTVAFHAPFCDLGDDTGGSKAIHRVSALILYYFLAAGHVKELVRSRSDPTMFTRSFKDACFWVENEGERPYVPPSRCSSTAKTASPDTIAVRPKRSSTMSSISRSTIGATRAHPVKRSATDSIDTIIKRERDDDDPARPRKHPRRTLSEQIIIPKLQDSMPSPRSPAPERVNRALTDRIQHLKDENAGLKDGMANLEGERAELQQRIAKEARTHRDLQTESENAKKNLTEELTGLKTRLGSVEAASEKLQGEVKSLRERVERAEKDAVDAKAELLAVRKGLTKELGEAVKKWCA